MYELSGKSLTCSWCKFTDEEMVFYDDLDKEYVCPNCGEIVYPHLVWEQEMEIRTVYEVEGDFIKGSGRTLGIFETEEEAYKHIEDCGCVDYGGNAEVNEQLAVSTGDLGKYYLIKNRTKYEMGVMEWSAAKDNHAELQLVLVKVKEKIPTMKFLRATFRLSLTESKQMVDDLPHTFHLSRGGIKNLTRELQKLGNTVRLEFTE